ncbi:MAG: mucoidy inhibitor MuiA family protein, partial [Opitutales bacterium]
MKHLLVALVLSTAFFANGLGAQEAPAKPKITTFESKITAVTVYADRARVTREATLDLAPKSNRFSFSKLPSWIDEGSVRVSLQTAAGAKGEVLDVQIRRTYLTAASDEEVRKAQDAVQEITDQLSELSDQGKVIDQRRKHLESIRVFALDKLPKDVATREVKVVEYTDFLTFLETSLTKLNADRRALEIKRRDLQPEQNVRQKRLSELNSKARLEERAVEIALRGQGQATVVLTYLLAGASWEPAHELRAEEKGEQVNISSYAVVRQSTGEDWGVAKLSFSTQNLSRTARIPELDTLLVGQGSKAPVRILEQQEDTYQKAFGNYKSQNRLWYYNTPIANQQIAI